MTDTLTVKSTRRHRKLHPAAVRTMHWINALAMILLIGSGWKIYNDEVLFGWLHFPDWMTFGLYAQHALQWHFFAMWVLMVERALLPRLWFLHRPFPPQAAADLAERGDRRRESRAEFQARA